MVNDAIDQALIAIFDAYQKHDCSGSGCFACELYFGAREIQTVTVAAEPVSDGVPEPVEGGT